MQKVSILLLTIDRYDLTREYVGNALRDAGYPFELCVTDNGSTDKRIIEWVEQQNPKVFFKNEENKGTTQSLNRMIEANPSDAWVFIGNDIELPKDWLKKLVETSEKIPQSGVVGINWRPIEFEKVDINGTEVLLSGNTFGTMFITKQTRDRVGKFCEDYGTYGLWDSDYSIRCNLAGLVNYYLCGVRSEHKGNDVEETTPYRLMKNASISKAKPIFEENVRRYKETNNYFI